MGPPVPQVPRQNEWLETKKKISTKTKNVWDLWDLWDRALNGKDAYVKNMSIKEM